MELPLFAAVRDSTGPGAWSAASVGRGTATLQKLRPEKWKTLPRGSKALAMWLSAAMLDEETRAIICVIWGVNQPLVDDWRGVPSKSGLNPTTKRSWTPPGENQPGVYESGVNIMPVGGGICGGGRGLGF